MNDIEYRYQFVYLFSEKRRVVPNSCEIFHVVQYLTLVLELILKCPTLCVSLLYLSSYCIFLESDDFIVVRSFFFQLL